MALLNKYPEIDRGFDTYVDISKATTWYFNNYKFNKSTSGDFTSLLLPWNRAWFDYDVPRTMTPDLTAIGFDVRMYEAPDVPTTFFDSGIADDNIPKALEEKEAGGYIIELAMYLEIGSRVLQEYAQAAIWVKETGEMQSPRNIVRFSDKQTDEYESLMHLFRHFVNPLLFSICLINCRNIELVDKRYSRQVMRQATRKGKELIKYKELIIEPFKKQVRAEATETRESEIHRALHICRGHFATYSEERPLFGKYSGTFWKPMHVRGSKEYGEIIKDYRIK